MLTCDRESLFDPTWVETLRLKLSLSSSLLRALSVDTGDRTDFMALLKR